VSRIILSRYPTGQERLVVGWDHPCGGAFWQEFNQEPAFGPPDDEWQEVLRERGFFQGIPLEQFRDSLPEDLEPLVTDRVMGLLAEHAADPDSGYRRDSIDLTAADV
jgi:hypothetical protein